MKKLLLSTILLILTCVTFAQYNNATANDLVMVKSENCYVYNTPHTISNVNAQDSLLKLPVGLPLKTRGYKDNYYKVNINGQEGYVFCLSVTTPKRIRDIREQMLLKIENQLHKLPTFEILVIIINIQDDEVIILDMQEYASTHSNTSFITRIISFYTYLYFRKSLI